MEAAFLDSPLGLTKIKFVKRLHLANFLFIASIAVIGLTPSAKAENGAGCGGNSVVCFADQTLADALIVRDEKTGLVITDKSIPDESIAKISLIESFDLYLESLKRGTDRTPRKIIDFATGTTDS